MPNSLNRRDFVKSGAVAAAFTFVSAARVRGSQANSRLNVGVVGNGGRGSLIARMLKAHPGYQVVGLADYFPDVSAALGEEIGVPEERCFSGLLGYQRLMNIPLDAVFLETPPYAFPDHVTYAVNKGVHVYMAKPIACDTLGTMRVLEMAEKAQQQKKVFLIDYQMRTEPVNIEIVKRIREGQLGGVGLIHSRGLSNGFIDPPRTGSIINRLRDLSWVADDCLGGGHLVNYDIHAVDAGLWIAGARPISAQGASRMVVNNANSDSHHVSSLTFQFENGILMNHISEHFNNVIDGSLDVAVYGEQGYAEIRYWGKAILRSNLGAYAGEVTDLYNAGIQRNIDSFHHCVTAGDVSNPTVQSGVNSNLAAILGREAAKRNSLLTMEQFLEENAALPVNYAGLVD